MFDHTEGPLPPLTQAPVETPILLCAEQLRVRHLGPLSLTLAAEEIAILRGPLGAGKTLLLRALADLDPNTGQVRLNDAMAAAGVVSLPGLMTGQILAGQAPLEADQILVLFLITVATGFGTLIAIWLGERRLFDERERLRLDHLLGGPSVP